MSTQRRQVFQALSDFLDESDQASNHPLTRRTLAADASGEPR